MIIKSPNKKESSFLFSTSLIFDENIDKLWISLKDLSSETKIINFLDNFKFIKGENTWTPGNIFSLYWIGVSNIEVKCISSFVTRMKKKIKWKFKCDIGISYYKSMILYRISNSHRTLVKLIMTRCEKNKLVDFSPQLNYYIDLQYDILNYQSKNLQNIPKDKIIYQSSIVGVNFIKLWNHFIDSKKIMNLCPNIYKDIEFKGNPNEVGTFVKLYQCRINKICFYKITKFIIPTKSKTFKCQYDAVGTELSNLPIIIEIQATMIEPNKTFFSVLYNFKNKSTNEIVEVFEIDLKNIINKFKEYIKENEKEFKSE